MAEGPRWHGIQPSTDRFVPPVQLERPEGPVPEPEKARPVWLHLEYEDDSRQTVKGFAMAWTGGAVCAQWVEFSRARKAWVPASACSRRIIGQPRTLP